MAKITITDPHLVAVNIIPANPDPQSALGKYAQNPDLNLNLPQTLMDELEDPLSKAGATPASVSIQLGAAFNFGSGEPQLSLGAGASAAVHVNAKKDADLFSDNLYQSPVKVSDGQGYVSMAFTGSVTGKESQSPISDITLGFDAGASATYEYFRSFDAGELLCVALGEVLSNFVIPADVTDLQRLRTGDVATCSGKRNLKVSAELSASASAVPLASSNLPLVGKPIKVNASAKIDLKTSFEITSDWQIRTRGLSDGVIELGVYKQHGSDWDITITASAGIDASVGTTDLLTQLITKLSTAPTADQKDLAAAGLQPDEIKAVNAAIKSSIDHSIHASLSLDLNGLASDEAAFLYRVELAKLNADTAAAVTAALDGDLTAIETMNPAAEENGIVGPGVTLIRSIVTQTRKSGVTFKTNLIGLINSLSLAEFVSKSEAIHEPTSGDLIFLKETASGDRIGVLTTPQAQTKLRKAMYDSILMTTAYRGGGVPGMDMECSQVHFALHSSTNEHTMSDYLDWFIGLGALTSQDKATIMTGFLGTGLSTCTARVTFNDQACKNLFLDATARAKPNDYYVKRGRQALVTLLLAPPGDQIDMDKYRRDVLSSDQIWNQFEGQPTIGPVMEQQLNWRSDDPRIQVLITDYTVIVWWAKAMSDTAAKVLDMQNYLKTANPVTLPTDKTFLGKAANLQKQVMSVMKNTSMDFSQPFGLVSLDWAADGAASASGVLLSPAIRREFATPAQAQAAHAG